INSEASFRFAGLYSADGRATTSFSTSAPVLMKCSFSVRRRIEGLQLSFSVFNFKGERIFYSTTSMANPAISVEAPGEHNITAQIPARLLLPGSYFINLVLHTPKTHLYDLRKQA